MQNRSQSQGPGWTSLLSSASRCPAAIAEPAADHRLSSRPLDDRCRDSALFLKTETATVLTASALG
jgi:hypothetical protein